MQQQGVQVLLLQALHGGRALQARYALHSSLDHTTGQLLSGLHPREPLCCVNKPVAEFRRNSSIQTPTRSSHEGFAAVSVRGSASREMTEFCHASTRRTEGGCSSPQLVKPSPGRDSSPSSPCNVDTTKQFHSRRCCR